MIPPNGFDKPDQVVKTYSFGGGRELSIAQEVGDYGTFWTATKNTPDGKLFYLSVFGQWTENINCSYAFDSEKKLLALIKKL